MNPQVMQLVIQGISLLPTLVQAGVDITGRVEKLVTVVKSGDTMSDAEIAQIRADFDKDMEEFDAPIDDSSST